MEWKLSALLLALLLPLAGANYMNYEIQMQGENADLELEMSLESDSPVNIFQGALILPKGADVLSVRDSKGKISDFTVNDNGLAFSTNYSVAKELEVVSISMRLNGVRNEEFAPLYSSRISLPAMQDSELSAVINGSGLISFEANHSFSGELTGERLEIAGTGPASVKFHYSDEGKDWGHYKVFNKSSLGEVELRRNGFNDTELYYSWIPKIMGIEPPFERFPLVILEDNDFSTGVNAYSEGVYRTGGIIIVRSRVFEDNAAPVILHETVHGFNAQAMLWNDSGSAWFDEGMAKFTEYLARKRLGMHIANLFEGVNEYREGDYIIRVHPANTVEELMTYYSQGETFIENWAPDSGENREFGYSFGELFVRKYVKENGFSKLLNAYREFLNQKEEKETGKEFTETALLILGAELNACNFPGESEVKDCLKELNKFNPGIPDTKSIIKLGLEEKEKEIGGLERVKELEQEKWTLSVREFGSKSSEMTETIFSNSLSEIDSFLTGWSQ